MEGAIVGDLTNEVEGLASGIGRDTDGSDGFLCSIDGELGRSYLWLLPPKEADSVAFWVG